ENVYVDIEPGIARRLDQVERVFDRYDGVGQGIGQEQRHLRYAMAFTGNADRPGIVEGLLFRWWEVGLAGRVLVILVVGIDRRVGDDRPLRRQSVVLTSQDAGQVPAR